MTVAEATEASSEVLGLSIRDLSAYFYANNGLVASTQLEKLYQEFDALTGLFYRVCLRKNTKKKVSIDYH